MLFELINNSVHTNSGNSFSRAFLLAENYKNKKNLLVFDTKKEMESFSKILAFVSQETISPIINLVQVVDFFGRENGWFVTTKDLFEANINWIHHVRKNSLLLDRNKDIAPEACVTSLIDSGYVHSVHLTKPGTYKKDGDTISIRPSSEDIVIALSFFDTIIDEILIFDTHGQFLTKKESILLSSTIDKRPVEEVEKRTTIENKELFSFLLDTQIIFMDLDFWDTLGEVSNDCRNFIIFCGSTTDIPVDIAIKEPKITSLQELELLVKNLGKNVSFYTKHTKALLNFLEYNNLLS